MQSNQLTCVLRFLIQITILVWPTVYAGRQKFNSVVERSNDVLSFDPFVSQNKKVYSCVNARGTPPAEAQVLALLMGGGGGGGVIQSWTGEGYPPSWSWMGYPRQQNKVPSCPNLGWGTPSPSSGPGVGYSPVWTRDGVPPPRPQSVNRLKLLPSLILRMRAVKTDSAQISGSGTRYVSVAASNTYATVL